jgi:hypothetical protein
MMAIKSAFRRVFKVLHKSRKAASTFYLRNGLPKSDALRNETSGCRPACAMEQTEWGSLRLLEIL